MSWKICTKLGNTGLSGKRPSNRC